MFVSRLSQDASWAPGSVVNGPVQPISIITLVDRRMVLKVNARVYAFDRKTELVPHRCARNRSPASKRRLLFLFPC